MKYSTKLSDTVHVMVLIAINQEKIPLQCLNCRKCPYKSRLCMMPVRERCSRTQGTCLPQAPAPVLHRPYASRCQRPALPARGPAPPPPTVQHGILYAGCRAAHSPHTGTVLLHRSVPLNNAEKRPAAFPAFCAAFPAPRHNPGRQAHCPAPDHKTGSGVGTPTALPRAECGAGRCNNPSAFLTATITRTRLPAAQPKLSYQPVR